MKRKENKILAQEREVFSKIRKIVAIEFKKAGAKGPPHPILVHAIAYDIAEKYGEKYPELDLTRGWYIYGPTIECDRQTIEKIKL